VAGRPVGDGEVRHLKWIDEPAQRQQPQPIAIGVLADERQEPVVVAPVVVGEMTMEMPPLGLGVAVRGVIGRQRYRHVGVRGAQRVTAAGGDCRADHNGGEGRRDAVDGHSFRTP